MTADSATHCQTCSKNFNFFTRRHICKGCNKDFCRDCTSVNHSFEEFGILETSRVCNACVDRFTQLKKANTQNVNHNTKNGAMPDKNSIDSMLESLMEERQLRGAAREKMRAMDVGQKWMLITAHRQETSTADKQKNDPTYWTDVLKTKGVNITPMDLKSLSVTLRGQTKTWMLQFMAGQGLALILEIIHSSKNIEVKLGALQCTSALLDTDVGLRQFLQLPAALAPMATMIKTEEDSIRVEILGLLSYVATADLDNGYPIVYEALTQPTLSRPPFQFLVDILSQTLFNNLKYEIMVLINALINAPDHLEDRNHTREQFIQAGILKAIAKIRDMIASQLLEGTAAAYSVVGLQDMNSSHVSPNNAAPSSPQRKITVAMPPTQRAGSTNLSLIDTPANATQQPGSGGMALSSVLEQLFVQCELFESALQEDKTESTRNGLDYSDMISLQNYIRTELAPRFSEYVLPLHQLLVAAPINNTQGPMIWSTLLAVLRRLLGQQENQSSTDYTHYYNPVSFQEIFALVDRAMYESGVGPKTANVDKAYNEQIESQRAELSQTMLRLNNAQEEMKKQKDHIEKLKQESRQLREALEKAEAAKAPAEQPPPPPQDDVPPPPTTTQVVQIQSDPKDAEKIANLSKEIESLKSQLDQVKSQLATASAATVSQSAPAAAAIASDIPICPDLFDEGLPTGPAPAGAPVSAPPVAAGPDTSIPICPDLFDEGLPVVSAASVPASAGTSMAVSDIPACPDLFDEGLSTTGGAAPSGASSSADVNGIPHCPDLFDEGLPTNAPKASATSAPAAGGVAALMANRAAAAPKKPVEEKIPMPYTRKVVKPQAKMRAIHWQKADDKIINESIWKEVNDTQVKLDYKELESLFCQSLPRSGDEKKETDGAPGARRATQQVQTVQFVEGQRQQNIAIAISRFKPLTNEQIRDAVLNMDEKTLPLEKVTSILKWLPAPEELEAIASYDGPAAALGNVEKYFAVIGQIPRLERRLEVFQFKLQFDLMFDDVSARIKVCLDALQNIYKSKRIKNLLQYVLAIGNFFNAGTNKGDAYGYKLSFLTKLSNTRTADNKSNLLNYLISEIDKDPENVGNFTEDISSCPDATRIELPTLQADVAKITVGVRKATNEVKNAKDPNEKFAKVVAQFVDRATPAADNLAADLEKMTKLSADIAKRFGEDPAQFGPDAIFSLFADLFNQVKTARANMEKAAKDKERQDRLAAANVARAKMSGDKKPTDIGSEDDSKPVIGPGALRKTNYAPPTGAPQMAVPQNDLAAAFARRQTRVEEAAKTKTTPAEPPSPSGTLRNQVDSALRGNDSADILKEINARRAARGQGRRLFGGSTVNPPNANQLKEE